MTMPEPEAEGVTTTPDTRALEALLFVSDEPLASSVLAQALEMEPGIPDVRAAIVALRRAGHSGRAAEIVERVASQPVHQVVDELRSPRREP